MLNTLYDDDTAVYVASESHQASVDNLKEKSHKQAVARGRKNAKALRNKFGEDYYKHLGRLGM